MKARPRLPDDIKDLMALVRKGRLFEVQKWIAAGKRTVPPEPYWFSPLRVAVETGFHSMVEILLQAGIDQAEKDYMLKRAVWNSNLDMIQLFVDHGADLHSVDFEQACGTGNPEIMRFFLDRGIDAVTGQPFANVLCRHPVRPHLGIYIHYRETIPDLKRQANLALRVHAREGNLKWVSLLLWAGADPYVRLPEIGEEPDPETDTTALEEAVRSRKHEIVEKIGAKPSSVDLNRLLECACSACDGPLIDKFLGLGANPNGTDSPYPPIDRLIYHLECEAHPIAGNFSQWEFESGLKVITRFADYGGRWKPEKEYEIIGFRRALYHLERKHIQKVIREFSEHRVCSSEVLLNLVSAPKMKQLLGDRHPKIIQSIMSPP